MYLKICVKILVNFVITNLSILSNCVCVSGEKNPNSQIEKFGEKANTYPQITGFTSCMLLKFICLC